MHEEARMMLPQSTQGSTFEHHLFLIANSTTDTSQTTPVSPVITANSNWQATVLSRNCKALHAPTRHSKLTISSMRVIRLKPYAHDKTP